MRSRLRHSRLTRLSLNSVVCVLFLVLFEMGCASGLKVLGDVPSEQLTQFLVQQCARPFPESLNGRLALRIDRKNRSIQLPARARIENGQVFLEITDPFGGSVLSAKSDFDRITVQSSARPEFNQTNASEWMGLPVRLMNQLVFNGIACPKSKVDINGLVYDKISQELKLVFKEYIWSYHVVSLNDQFKVDRIRVVRPDQPELDLEYTAQDWDEAANVRRGLLVSSEGKLGWAWRSRQP